MLQQEFTKDGLPSMRPYLNYLLDNGATEQVNVKWGKGYRNVIVIGGKKYLYKGGDEFNKNLKKKITSLYISMSDNSSKEKKKIIKEHIESEEKDNALKRIRLNQKRELFKTSSRGNPTILSKKTTMCNWFLMLRR